MKHHFETENQIHLKVSFLDKAPGLYLSNDFTLDIEAFSPAGRLLPAGTLPAVSESAHPAEKSGPQHSGQHPLKGTQTNTHSVAAEAHVCSHSCGCISYSVGTFRRVPVSSARQRGVYSARRRPALPAPLCVG